MTIKNELLNGLVELSQTLGSSIANVQGGGGNISVKLTPGKMVIKPSGTFLREFTHQNSGVSVDIVQVRQYIHSNVGERGDISTHENDLNSLINQHTASTRQQKASIETSLHALLPARYVAHTHSVVANVFTCAENGSELLKEILPNIHFRWLEYAAPGFSLARLLHETFIDGNFPDVIFLKNHGIVIAANTSEQVIKTYNAVIKSLVDYLDHRGIAPFIGGRIHWFEDGVKGEAYVGEYLAQLFGVAKLYRHLFPDSVVFGEILLSNDLANFDISYDKKGKLLFSCVSMRRAQIVYENLLAMNYILCAHRSLRLGTVYLSQADVDYILSMEMEKYRNSINK